TRSCAHGSETPATNQCDRFLASFPHPAQSPTRARGGNFPSAHRPVHRFHDPPCRYNPLAPNPPYARRRKPMAAKPIPDDYRGATPYLCCRDAAKAIDFYVKAFGAREMFRSPMPDGKIGHAEIRMGDAIVMLA